MRNLSVLLLLLPIIISTFVPNNLGAYAAEAVEDDLVDVDSDEGAVTGEDAEADDELDISGASPHANTYLLFTKPLHTAGQQLDLPGGKPVDLLIGFTNKGQEEFVIETLEASFRYPMDFNYFIQNFSAVAYNREVKSGFESTISYTFLPSDQFAGRPFGLHIALAYRDANGIQYNEAIFNETVLISEVDEGLDGETFFLYLMLAGIFVLLLVIGQQYLLGSSGKRKRSSAKKVVEIGTASDSNIDYDWVPQETMRALQKSPAKSKMPKTSPKPSRQASPKASQQSPKQRKVKRSMGDD